MPSLQELGQEAICSALYNMSFTVHLGERLDPATGGEVQWFKMCREGSEGKTGRDDPQQVMISVRPEAEGIIVVQAGWLNLSGPTVLKAEQTFHIPTLSGYETEVRRSTEQVVLRLLDIYQDVLTGEGVAGPLEDAAPESEAGDPDDERDMAVPGE